MITNKSREELWKVGRFISGQRMVDQARYTVKLAAEDAPVAAALGKEFLAEVEAAVQRLDRALHERKVAGGESVAATVRQKAAIRRGKEWRRACVHRMKMALRKGIDIQPLAARVGDKNPNAGELATDLDRLVKTGTERLAVLGPVGVTAEFLKRGAELSRVLKELDQEQEAQFRARRRDAVAEARALSGMVLLAVRQINDMGRSVHAGDRVKALQYSLAVLQRNLPTPAAGAEAESKPSGEAGKEVA